MDEVSWLAVCVSVDQTTGTAWVVVRDHPNIPESKPELLAVDKNGRVHQRIDLGDLVPFSVAVDSDNGIVWVGCLGTTLRYTTQGEKLKSAKFASGFSIVPGASGDSVIAASDSDLVMATVADTGRVDVGFPPIDVRRDLLSSNQKWVAKVPWAGAKLQSSPELARLTLDKDAHLKLTDYPESAEKLRALGKALLMYANDYDDKLPDALGNLRAYVDERNRRSYVNEADLKWFQDNVEYLGKGMNIADRPDLAVAYDKTVLRRGEGTLVLYLDSRVAFEGPHKLDTLGIVVPPAATRPDDPGEARMRSAEILRNLGGAALFYTITHENRLPDRIEDLPEEPGLAKSWLAENVMYLGKHMRTHSEPDTPIAYDRTLLQAGQGTNVLYLDTRVVFEGTERLKTLGIIGVPPESRTQLEELGQALLIYASQYVHKYPDTLQDARNYISEKGDFSWILANVAYLGKGGTPREQPGRILAYDKTLLREGQGTFALYRDSHVEWVLADRLAARGIRFEP